MADLTDHLIHLIELISHFSFLTAAYYALGSTAFHLFYLFLAGLFYRFVLRIKLSEWRIVRWVLVIE